MTLGSLFDGAGTFPFAARQFGIKTCWASEIETFPISVTKKRFPKMIHLGDITKINGAEIEPVDIITFGSPCQDLSIAGKQAGLQGERSGLFMEAIRIIKEMRGSTNGRYPRYAVWENVPGAFSSNEREDFKVVLEELCKVKDESANVPRPTSRGGNGKWQNAGLILADEYSVAWRVLDAQYWGVPQRRRRIFLVADFRGQSAGEILFKRDGLSRDFKKSRETWKGITSGTTYSTDLSRKNHYGGITRNGDNDPIIIPLENHPSDSRVILSKEKIIQTLTSRMGTGGGNVPLLLDVCRKKAHPRNTEEGRGWEYTTIADTFNVNDNSETRMPIRIVELDMYNQSVTNDRTKCLIATKQDAINIPCVAITKLTNEILNDIYCASDETYFAVNKDKAPPLKQRDYKTPDYVCIPKQTQWVVRRITPTECARLQGMPDWWCKDIPHSDAAEYKMWGNGMALPCVMYVMEGIAIELKNEILEEI